MDVSLAVVASEVLHKVHEVVLLDWVLNVQGLALQITNLPFFSLWGELMVLGIGCDLWLP